MTEIGFSRPADLTFVGLAREDVGFLEDRDLFLADVR
jgi:hypothetical protein